MHVTDLPIHGLLGIELAPAGSEHILELTESAIALNHVGTVHAGVQFALAEGCSGEFLLRQLDDDMSGVLVAANVKYRRPARGKLKASARFTDEGKTSARDRLTKRRRALVSILVEVVDADGTVTMEGQYDWLLQGKNAAR